MYRAHGVSVAPYRPRPTPYLIPSSRGLETRVRISIYRLLLLGWPRQMIADREGCSLTAVRNVEVNLKEHGSVRRPPEPGVKLGRPPKISDEDGEALFEELIRGGWKYQDEIAYWLWIERGVKVTQSTVSRFLHERNWTRRSLRPFSVARNEELREGYRYGMRSFAQEDLVFLDESIFNEKTGWRHKAYGPVGHESRYTQDIQRGKSWAILPAYTINGYLPCTGIKEGYFNHEEFLDWIHRELLPCLRLTYGHKPMVIVLDNVSIHTNDAVRAALEAAGHIVRFLPPYSPDYNPIELTFSVLKYWIKRNYVYERQRHDRFGSFLREAVRRSRCDRFARKHFTHAAGGLYIEQDTLYRVRAELRAQRGRDDHIEGDEDEEVDEE